MQVYGNDIYNNYNTKAITDIWNSSKRPNEKAITDYVKKILQQILMSHSLKVSSTNY